MGEVRVVYVNRNCLGNEIPGEIMAKCFSPLLTATSAVLSLHRDTNDQPMRPAYGDEGGQFNFLPRSPCQIS